LLVGPDDVSVIVLASLVAGEPIDLVAADPAP
jgi:hypothetical protein